MTAFGKREPCDRRAEDPKVIPSVAQLSERRQREVLLALYRDRLDYRRARAKFGVNAEELNGLHQGALDALIECVAPGFHRSDGLCHD